jgi:hypothetical protein
VQICGRKADRVGRSLIQPLLVSREPSASCCTELAEGLSELSAESLVVFGEFTVACVGDLEAL